MRRGISLVAIVGVMALIAAACSNDSSSSVTDGSSATALSYDPSAQGEGELNLVAWPLYAEKDVTGPFEDATGCKVNVKEANTSDEMVNLMSQGQGTQYDGVSASGDASLRLIASGLIAPVNVDSFDDYGNVMTSLQAPAHNTVNGVHYGVPYEWGPNILMYNSDVVSPPPKSWDVTFEPQINGQANPYAGKITGYNSPIFIADAAMYLMAHQPDLGITDPYELTSDQLDAAVNLLKQQNGLVSKYWNVWSDEVDAFESGDMVAGTAWPANQNVLFYDDKVNVGSVTPSEGVTGWADTWMMSSNAPHPNCMLAWMNYTLSDKVQAATAYTFGATPSVTTACEGLKKNLIAGYGQDVGSNAYPLYHCGDDSYLKSIYLWKTPVPDCGNGSSDCADYNTWTQKWVEVTG
ncbi:MAG TPA: extracellular solute-binding protein [Actinomycetota bacterium]|jgi:putative spermidine/putrescine transport system substrate-binding protein|nr:extracellular solute-binding protein [Actinomycetota bacterium]